MILFSSVDVFPFCLCAPVKSLLKDRARGHSRTAGRSVCELGSEGGTPAPPEAQGKPEDWGGCHPRRRHREGRLLHAVISCLPPLPFCTVANGTPGGPCDPHRGALGTPSHPWEIPAGGRVWGCASQMRAHRPIGGQGPVPWARRWGPPGSRGVSQTCLGAQRPAL